GWITSLDELCESLALRLGNFFDEGEANRGDQLDLTVLGIFDQQLLQLIENLRAEAQVAKHFQRQDAHFQIEGNDGVEGFADSPSFFAFLTCSQSAGLGPQDL